MCIDLSAETLTGAMDVSRVAGVSAEWIQDDATRFTRPEKGGWSMRIQA